MHIYRQWLWLYQQNLLCFSSIKHMAKLETYRCGLIPGKPTKYSRKKIRADKQCIAMVVSTIIYFPQVTEISDVKHTSRSDYNNGIQKRNTNCSVFALILSCCLRNACHDGWTKQNLHLVLFGLHCLHFGSVYFFFLWFICALLVVFIE